LLYFDEYDLNVWEWDRTTVEGDQFEVIAESGNGGDICVEYKYRNKQQVQSSDAGLESDFLMYMSPSDLSALSIVR
jgi:hypothetical protein